MKKPIIYLLLLFCFQSSGQIYFGKFGNTPAIDPLPPYTRQNLILTADAESGTLPSPFDAACGDITRSSNFAESGSQSYRVYTSSTSDPCASGIRAELNMFSELSSNGYDGFERWIGYSIYWPSGYTFETNADYDYIITQFHDNPQGGETERHYVFSLVVVQNKLRYRIRWGAGGGSEQLRTMELSNPDITTGGWHDIVIHFRTQTPSGGTPNDGLVEIWMDNVKLTNYTGPLGFNQNYSPFFKIGGYAWIWNSENMDCCGSNSHKIWK